MRHFDSPAEDRLSASERLALLLDEDSFEPTEAAGLVGGRGSVGGRPVFAFAHDRAAAPESEPDSLRAIARLHEAAAREKSPVLGLHDPGARTASPDPARLAAQAAAIAAAARCAGAVPRIALLLGRCAGADALLAASADLVWMVEGGAAFLAGPPVVRAVTREIVDDEALGGAALHGTRSGLADGVFGDEVTAILQLRRLVDLLPLDRAAGRAPWPTLDRADRREPSLDTLVPSEPTRAYDMRELVLKLVDECDFLELGADHAGNLVTGLARLDGRPVAILANQPLVLAGVLDLKACRKGARFVRFCEDLGLPLVVLVDCPGFLPGTAEEHAGITRAAAELATALAAAKAPRVTVRVRNAAGSAHATMTAGARPVLAWPSAGDGAGGISVAAIAPRDTRAAVIAALAEIGEAL